MGLDKDMSTVVSLLSAIHQEIQALNEFMRQSASRNTLHASGSKRKFQSTIQHKHRTEVTDDIKSQAVVMLTRPQYRSNRSGRVIFKRIADDLGIDVRTLKAIPEFIDAMDRIDGNKRMADAGFEEFRTDRNRTVDGITQENWDDLDRRIDGEERKW